MTSNQLQYQRNLISTNELEESKRHNLMTEMADFNRAVAALKQAGASQQQAEAALLNAAASSRNAETNSRNFWFNVASAIGSQFGLTPMSASEIGANVGKGLSGIGSFLF